jgi:hypothetical protein
MADVAIRLIISDNGTISVLDDAKKKVDNLNDSVGKSNGGAGGMVAGTAQMVQTATGLIAGASAAAMMIDRVNDLGAASIRTHNALDRMSDGRGESFLRAMRDEVKGLVPDMDLAAQATKGLTLGVIETEEHAAMLAKAGAILGVTMGSTAAQGVETLTVALSRVGQTMLLDNIGLSANVVMKRFNELKGVMGDQKAWSTAVLEDAAGKTKKLEASLDDVGTALDRNKIRFQNWATGVSENVSKSIDGIIRIGEAANQAWQDSQIEMWKSEAKEHADMQATNENYVSPSRRGFKESADNYSPINNEAYLDAIASYQKAAAEFRNKQQLQNPATGGTGGAFGAVTDRDSTLPNIFEMVIGKQLQAIQNQKGFNDMLNMALTPLNAMKTVFGDIANTKVPSSVSEAFGLSSGGIGGELGGGFNQSLQTQAQKYAEDQKKKIGTGGYYQYADTGTIKAFDEKAKSDLDAYNNSLKNMNVELSAADMYAGKTADNIKKGMADKYAQGQQKQRGKLRQTKGKVYTKKDYDSDVATYNKEMQKVADEYAIATGQATKESIKARDAQSSLAKQFADGKLTLAQYKTEMLNLVAAIKGGATGMEDYKDFQARLDQQTEERYNPNYGKDKGKQENDEKASNDPAAPIKKSYEEAGKTVDTYISKQQAVAPQAAMTGIQAAKNIAPVGGAWSTAQKFVESYLAMQKAVDGSVIHVSIATSVSGGGTFA